MLWALKGLNKSLVNLQSCKTYKDAVPMPNTKSHSSIGIGTHNLYPASGLLLIESSSFREGGKATVTYETMKRMKRPHIWDVNVAVISLRQRLPGFVLDVRQVNVVHDEGEPHGFSKARRGEPCPDQWTNAVIIRITALKS